MYNGHIDIDILLNYFQCPDRLVYVDGSCFAVRFVSLSNHQKHVPRRLNMCVFSTRYVFWSYLNIYKRAQERGVNTTLEDTFLSP